MAYSRSKIIQKTGSKKFEELSPEISLVRTLYSKPLSSSKFTPVLNRKSANSRMSFRQNTSKPRESNTRETKDTSPNNSSTVCLSQTSSSHFFSKKKPRVALSNSNSANFIQSNKSICERWGQKTGGGSVKKHLTRERSREASKSRDLKSRNETDKYWRKVINDSNGIESYAGTFTSYTAYIGKGNNHPLVRKILLKRPWWKLVDNKETANFVWSQWRDKQLLADMKSYTGRVGKSKGPGHALSEIENLGVNLIIKSKSYLQLTQEKLHSDQQRLVNKLEFNYCLTNKKGLYHTMKAYYNKIDKDLFTKLPVTFNVSSIEDPEYSGFLSHFHLLQSSKKNESLFRNIWIVKPGEFTNRGTGITVCKSIEEIQQIIKPSTDKTYIIQKYIENPLLINKRKFDIRCYALITSINGVTQGYFYLDGYLRTTSQEFSVDETDPFVHLTNDAIQKYSAEYGKYENGNKLAYRDFQKYLDRQHPEISFYSQILPLIKDLVKDTMVASYKELDKNKRTHCMEIFGYDFMIDSNFKPWLIEINTNPCLELSSSHLRLIIPAMLENAFRIVIDSLFTPPLGQHQDVLGTNRFELIFHSESDGIEEQYVC